MFTRAAFKGMHEKSQPGEWVTGTSVSMQNHEDTDNSPKLCHCVKPEGIATENSLL